MTTEAMGIGMIAKRSAGPGNVISVPRRSVAVIGSVHPAQGNKKRDAAIAAAKEERRI
jgi:hypothetical protein